MADRPTTKIKDMNFSKNVYHLSPDEQGRERVENRAYGSVYTNIIEDGERPVHTVERNGLEGTWAAINKEQTVVLSKDTFFYLKDDAGKAFS